MGINEETGLPTVGFRIGSYVNGTTGVGPIDDLIHIPPVMKIAVNVSLYNAYSNTFESEINIYFFS